MPVAQSETAPQAYARQALGKAALRAEFFISLIRAALSVVFAVRFVVFSWLQEREDLWFRGAFSLAPTLFTAAFSILLLVRLRQERVSPRLLGVSVCVDAVTCTLALASNVLSPWPGYPGVARLPEFAVFIATMLAAGFRASSRLALVGAIANTAGAILLIVCDRMNPGVPPVQMDTITVYSILFSSAAALSILGARRTERLVLDAATYSYKTTRAEQSLSRVLEGHHDALSLLSAALFDVKRLKSVEAGQEEVMNLSRDLELLHGAVGQIKEQALREVLVLRPPVRVSLHAALERPRATFGRMVAPTRVEWDIDPLADNVQVAGGVLALQRLLANLLVNARDGDGARGATRIRVEVKRVKDSVTIRVEDDGPGFPEGTDWLEEDANLRSSKLSGTATGLRFVRAVAEASGGSLQVGNTSEGGEVRIVLLVAQNASAMAM